jgi:hypothetical protein
MTIEPAELAKIVVHAKNVENRNNGDLKPGNVDNAYEFWI